MNINQIIDMVIRQVTNRLIRSGINSGMNAGSNLMKKRKPNKQHQGEIDDYGNPTKRGPRV